jgi:SAM-dependent methyltransferase
MVVGITTQIAPSRGRRLRAPTAAARILSAVAYPERIVPDETSPGIVALHLKRYEFAAPWCRDRAVLDAGCGVGYGTAHLAGLAASVVGVDRDEDAIAYARERYARPNVEFRVGDLLDLELADGSFDVVCSFETIEHVEDVDGFLAEIVRVLRPEGVFLVSTPRVDETTASPENPFHRVELSPGDFEALLRRSFPEVELYGQRRLQTARHRLMQRVDVLGLRKRLTFLRPTSRLLGTAPTAEVTSDGIVIERGDLERASELVAVCRR